MTITKRNRRRTQLINSLAEKAGAEAQKFQLELCGDDACACINCGPRAYEDAARQEFSWLRSRNLGVPALQLMMGQS